MLGPELVLVWAVAPVRVLGRACAWRIRMGKAGANLTKYPAGIALVRPVVVTWPRSSDARCLRGLHSRSSDLTA